MFIKKLLKKILPNFIKEIFFKLIKHILLPHYSIGKSVSRFEIMSFIDKFKSMLVSVDLIRIGNSNGDGGYLVPNNLDGIKYCFSPGVADTSLFEKELSQKFGIKSFMIDASVENPIIEDELFDFESKFLGRKNQGDYITLSTWIEDKVPNKDNNMILQMDIEGDEYPVLLETPIDVLSRFRYMVIEFHELEHMCNPWAMEVLHIIFDKLGQKFSIAHVHQNNNARTVKLKGIAVAPVIEVTFIRNDCIKQVSNNKEMSFPHPLDRKTTTNNSDTFPEVWWKH